MRVYAVIIAIIVFLCMFATYQRGLYDYNNIYAALEEIYNMEAGDMICLNKKSSNVIIGCLGRGEFNGRTIDIGRDL